MADESIPSEQLERYRTRQMTPDELRALDRLLQEDPAARRQFARQQRRTATPQPGRSDDAFEDLEDTFRRLGLDGVHPPPELLHRFVDGGDLAVRERGRLEAHLAGCARCRDDVAALRQLRAQITTVVLPAPPAPERSRVRRSFAWTVPALAAANAVVLVGLWWGTSRVASEQTERLRREQAQVIARANVSVQQAHQAQQERDRIALQARTERERATRKVADAVKRAQEQADRAARLAAVQIAQNREIARLKKRAPGRGPVAPPIPDPDNTWRVAQVTRDEQRAFESALRTSEAPPWRSVSPDGGKRGSDPAQTGSLPARPGTFGPVYPARTAIAEPRPILLWNPRSGVAGYQVAVLDAQRRIIARNEAPIPGDVTRYELPVSLERGQSYQWRLAAVDASGEELPGVKVAGFRVAPLADARRQAAALLRVALLDATAGLYDDAVSRLKRVQTIVPGAPEAKKAAALESSLGQRGRGGAPLAP